MSTDAICVRRGHGCPSYRAGHTVHFIQARKVSEFLDHFPERCRSVELADLGEGHFSTVIDGATLRGWNHSREDITEFARASRRGLVQYVPYSGVFIRTQFDDAGRIIGRAVVNPFWEGGTSPETDDDLPEEADRVFLYARAVDTQWNCDVDAPGHGCTGGVADDDLPMDTVADRDFIPVSFGSGGGGRIEVRFPDGTVRTAHHCDHGYLMIFITARTGGGVFFDPGSGLLVTGRPAHRKFLSISWDPLARCSRSDHRDR